MSLMTALVLIFIANRDDGATRAQIAEHLPGELNANLMKIDYCVKSLLSMAYIKTHHDGDRKKRFTASKKGERKAIENEKLIDKLTR